MSIKELLQRKEQIEQDLLVSNIRVQEIMVEILDDMTNDEINKIIEDRDK